nr:hypothetical protein [Solirubrobacterales bacterium]
MTEQDSPEEKGKDTPAGGSAAKADPPAPPKVRKKRATSKPNRRQRMQFRWPRRK